jgi:uncharacterized membrane-anchored protein
MTMHMPFRILVVISLLLWSWGARAQDAQPSAAQLAWQAAVKTATTGPADIALGDQGVLHLPSEMLFINKTEASSLMKAWGNSVDEKFLGMVVPRKEDQNWVLTVDHVAEGFVKDDEAKNWNAEELLQSLRDGTEEQNKQRLEMGIPAMDVVGWIEPPNYDATSHRLVWSLRAVDRGAPTDAPATVNYNTYALGRDGYFELNMLTSDAMIAQEKRYARQLLAALEYNSGKKYGDFDASTDHIAEYGLAALVGGIAAKKLGLLALAGVFFLKFAKFIAIGAAVFGAAIVQFFRKRSS